MPADGAGLTPFHLNIETAGPHRLPVVRRGHAEAPLVIFAQPLFEELNRCRRLLADVGAALAGHGIASALPDLPRSGDHQDMRPFDLGDARAALDAYAEVQSSQSSRPHIVSLRGGGLLADPGSSAGLYALSPVSGERLLTELVRAHAAGERERTGKSFGRREAEACWARGENVHLAGYEVTAATAQALVSLTVPDASRSRGIGSRPGEIPGPPVWRQADPVRALETAAAVADEIADWMQL